MNPRTWNLILNATQGNPSASLEGVSRDDAAKIVRDLTHGPDSTEYVWQAAAVAAGHHEGPLAA